MKKRLSILTLAITASLLTGCGTNALAASATKDSNEVSTGIYKVTSAVQIQESQESVPETTQEQVPETTAAPEPDSVSVVMVGDILLHTPVEKSALQADGSYVFDTIFENMAADIQAADLAIVNQEVILGGEELGISGYPAFNAPFSVGDALVNAGFDVICHGTNHALDKGKKGLLNCLNFWKETYPDVAVLGIHDSQESQDQLYVYEKDGIRIAVLNYTYGTNGIALPKDMPYAVDLLKESQIVSALQRAEELADFTIVCPHWGTEYQLKQSAEQERWARLFVKHGADLILGTHPHVIQPMEWVTDEESGNQALVYYSIGNFVNWTSGSGKGVANRMVGGMAEVTLTSVDGKVMITDHDVEPVICHLEKGTNGVTVYKLAEYTSELAEQNQIRLQDPTFSLEYCQQLCKNVWGTEN